MSSLLVLLFIGGVIRTVIVIMVVYYLLRFIVRLAFPSIIKKFMRKHGFDSSSPDQRSEGEVTLEGEDTPKKSKIPKEDGEYVDFEEID